MEVKKVIYDISTKSKTVEIIEVSAEPDFDELNKKAVREQRDMECFPIINRGQLWYSLLTEAQLVELNAWYHAWLDATDTLVIPEKPIWLE